MKLECAYSFKDLYVAAFGREPDQAELLELYAYSQELRNQVVKEWAQRADWGVQDRVGSDGVVYAAFCPLWKVEPS